MNTLPRWPKRLRNATPYLGDRDTQLCGRVLERRRGAHNVLNGQLGDVDAAAHQSNHDAV